MRISAVAGGNLAQQTLGIIDYYRFPERRAAWGGPFNGQASRRRLVEEIVTVVQPKAFVETGTHTGTTTEFLAHFGKPVFSVEGNPRAYGFAKSRFRKCRNVTLVRDDSRSALRQWFNGPLRTLVNVPLFFYLDAHWNLDLPLAEELEIIFARCNAAVVMIDDFQVLWDAAYGYDDFGPGKVLNADYITQTVCTYGLAVFYPSTSAAEESGMRRGCVVLASEVAHRIALRSLSLLCAGPRCGL